jgi:2,3-bisphosphoglycerate-dependent phosphoglycerate mutase
MNAASKPGGRRLILVRHSLSALRREVPPHEWRLSPDGIARARAFASRLDPSDITTVFSSVEPKAVETARALAEQWGVEVEEVPGLHEHERPEPQILAREQFERKVEELFARPSELVFGAETADQARRRFTMALMRLIARGSGDIVAVTHGTVMTLFVSEATGIAPFPFWQRQEMPFAVTLTLPELTLVETTFLNESSGTHQQPSSGR